MNTNSPSAKAEALIASLEQYGQGDYIGESISQLEHCLQAANQAREAGECLATSSRKDADPARKEPEMNW